MRHPGWISSRLWQSSGSKVVSLVTKHTSRSLLLRKGIRSGLGYCVDETLGDTMDTDLQLQLGMETTHDSDAVGEDTSLLQRVALPGAHGACGGLGCDKGSNRGE